MVLFVFLYSTLEGNAVGIRPQPSNIIYAISLYSKDGYSIIFRTNT